MFCVSALCRQHTCSRVMLRTNQQISARYTSRNLPSRQHNRASLSDQPIRRHGPCAAVTTRGVQLRASADDSAQSTESKATAPYEHVMLTLVDPSPYLSDGSKQAIAAAVTFGESSNNKVTVTLLEAEQLAEEDRKKQVETVMWHFQQKDFTKFEVLQKEAGKVAVTIGDLADEVGANLVIMSVESIHAKVVDANLLAEFVPCPILLLP